MNSVPFVLILSLVFCCMHALNASESKLVIAHRGASGYLPEHTLAAKALAYAQGADYIEQDVVVTRDDRAIVLHDIHLDTTTNVAELFPNRKRDDGRYYAIDFTLAEIKQLTAMERINPKSGRPVFEKRFPQGKSSFQVPTLEEEIELIQGLNHSSGKHIGIYPEIKDPAWHHQHDKDISVIVLDILNHYGYKDKTDAVFLQCFDAKELKRVRFELNSRLKLIQLIGDNDWGIADTDYDELRTVKGLKEVATYADGIGPSIGHVITGVDREKQLQTTPLVVDAKEVGLLIHPYTFRADLMPPFVQDYKTLVSFFYHKLQVDGLFTDFPDLTVQARDQGSRIRQ